MNDTDSNARRLGNAGDIDVDAGDRRFVARLPATMPASSRRRGRQADEVGAAEKVLDDRSDLAAFLRRLPRRARGRDAPTQYAPWRWRTSLINLNLTAAC
jgi:hypothetical protein